MTIDSKESKVILPDAIKHQTLKHLNDLNYDTSNLSEDNKDIILQLFRDLSSAKGRQEELQRRLEAQTDQLQKIVCKLADAKTTISGQQKQNAALKHELDRALDITHTLKNEQKRSSRESTSQIAVLKSAAHHASQRASDYEKECAGLRLKVQKLLEISDKCRIVDMNIADVASTIDISSHLDAVSKPIPSPSASSSLSKESINLVKLAAARVAMLENQVSMQRTVLMDQEEALDVAKRASDAREKEIQRLQAHISEHEKVFHDKHALKQLSQHADNMAAELASLKESMHGDGKKLEVSEIARIDAEKRVNNAIKDKEAALQHVKRLETELETLQKEVNYAEKEKNTVSKLRLALDQAKTNESTAQTRAEAADKKIADLQNRLERREAALKHAQKRCHSVEGELHRLRQLQGVKKKEQQRNIHGNSLPSSDEMQKHCDEMASHLMKAVELQDKAIAVAEITAAERNSLQMQVLILQSKLEESQRQVLPTLPCLERSTNTTDEEEELPRPDTIPFAVVENVCTMDAATNTETNQSIGRTPGVILHNHTIDSHHHHGNQTARLISQMQDKLNQKSKECEDLAAAGMKNDILMQDCLNKLHQTVHELQDSQARIALLLSEVSGYQTQLREISQRYSLLENQKTEVERKLHEATIAAEQQIESMTLSLRAEREAASNDFNALRMQLHSLCAEYEEISEQLSLARKERDNAAQHAQHTATQAAFHQQQERAVEAELLHQQTAYNSLAEEHRALQETLSAAQRELAAQSCEAQCSSERIHGALRRRLAAAESSVAMLQARLKEARNEISAHRQRADNGCRKVEELECLLAAERSRQFEREQHQQQGKTGTACDAPEVQHKESDLCRASVVCCYDNDRNDSDKSFPFLPCLVEKLQFIANGLDDLAHA